MKKISLLFAAAALSLTANAQTLTKVWEHPMSDHTAAETRSIAALGDYAVVPNKTTGMVELWDGTGIVKEYDVNTWAALNDIRPDNVSEVLALSTAISTDEAGNIIANLGFPGVISSRNFVAIKPSGEMIYIPCEYPADAIVPEGAGRMDYLGDKTAGDITSNAFIIACPNKMTQAVVYNIYEGQQDPSYSYCLKLGDEENTEEWNVESSAMPLLPLGADAETAPKFVARNRSLQGLRISNGREALQQATYTGEATIDFSKSTTTNFTAFTVGGKSYVALTQPDDGVRTHSWEVFDLETAESLARWTMPAGEAANYMVGFASSVNADSTVNIYQYNPGIRLAKYIFAPGESSGEDTDPEPEPDPDANSMYINDVTTFCGKTATLSLQMKNNFEVVGFQCDFYAPAGTSVAVDEYGYNMIELSTERTNPKNTNFFDNALQDDGSIRILASSTKNIAISGTSGEVATIVLNVGADLEGEYPLILRNIVLADADGNAYKLPDTQAVLTVKKYILGDANGDGSINVGDYSIIASYILGRTLDNFVMEAADTNEDGIINVGDLSGLVRMILGGAKAPALAPQLKATDVSEYENAIYGVDAIVNSESTAVMSICMKNSIAVPGYQFDFIVPEGFEVMKDDWGYYLIELSTERTNPKNTNLFDFADQTDGSIRVLCSSSRNATFSGNDGEVCTIKFKMKEGVTAGSYDVKFKNIVMSDTEGKSYDCEDVTVALIVSDNVGAQMAKSDGAEIEAIYGVDGVKRSGMQQGVNIVRYTDGTTKKVIKK